MINVRQFFFGPLRVHCMVAWGDDLNAVIVDPGMTSEAERNSVAELISGTGLVLRAVLLTHSHFDHFYSAKWCSDSYAVPVYLHGADFVMTEPSARDAVKYGLPVPDYGFQATEIKEGDILNFGELSFEVIHTPGHSPGGVCYYDRTAKKLFTGDTLFAGTIGRSDFWLGNYDDEIVSIMDKLMVLDSDTVIYPGHGGCSSIGYERTHNPFLEPFNEKDPETGAVDGVTVEDR